MKRRFRARALVRSALLSFALGAGFFSTCGCYRVTAIDGAADRAVERTRWAHFFLFGTVGDEQFDVRRICRGPAPTIRTSGDVLTTAVGVLTFGIYTPRQVTLTCAPTQASR
jgi:hypothetical protein